MLRVLIEIFRRDAIAGGRGVRVRVLVSDRY